MNETHPSTLHAWLTPEGITAIIAIVGMILAGARMIAQHFKLTRAAETIEALEGRKGQMEKLAGVLVRGVQNTKTKGVIDPSTFLEVIRTIQAESEKHGTEDVLNPIVKEIQKAPEATPPEIVVRSATTRLKPDEPPRRVS